MTAVPREMAVATPCPGGFTYPQTELEVEGCDYVKILHSIVTGEWSAPLTPGNEDATSAEDNVRLSLFASFLPSHFPYL